MPNQDELLRASMDSANECFKACLLLNGGAALALLTFAGHLATQQNYSSINDFTPAFLWFVFGVALVPIGHGLSYGANLCFALRPAPSGSIFRCAAIAAAVGSVLFFIIG